MNSFEMEDIQFDEIDNEDYPTQIYYWWQAETSQIRDLILECELSDGNDEFDIDTELSARVVLTIFTKRDFKLQLLVSDEYGKQNWYDICFQFTNANEFIELIPDYGNFRIHSGEQFV